MMSQAESYVILLSRYRVYIYREDYAHQEKELETVGHDSAKEQNNSNVSACINFNGPFRS